MSTPEDGIGAWSGHFTPARRYDRGGLCGRLIAAARFLSFEFFASRTRTVMTLKKSPRKNHSHALRPVLCAHSAQKAPKRNKATPSSDRCTGSGAIR